MNRQAKIDEIVSFLHNFSPDSINELEITFPNNKDLLKKGKVFGDSKFAVQDFEIRSKICVSGLSSVIKVCENIIPILKSKIKKLNKIQLISQIVITLSSATLLSILEKEDAFIIFKYLAAVLTLLGSLLNIYFQYISNQLLPTGNSIFNDYNSIIDGQIDGQKLLQQLTLLSEIKSKNDDCIKKINDIIESGDQLCLKLNKIIPKLNV